LGILLAVGTLAFLIFDTAHRSWDAQVQKEIKLQSLYIAEAGLTLLENNPPLIKTPDTSHSTDSTLKKNTLTSIQLIADSTPASVWKGRRDLSEPQVTLGQENAYLQAVSRATYKGYTTHLFAQYGYLPNDSLFRAAALLTQEQVIHPSLERNIEGILYIKSSLGGGTLKKNIRALSNDFNLSQWIDGSAVIRVKAYDNYISRKLAETGGHAGHLDFRNGKIPNFQKDSVIFSPLGGADISYIGQECLHIKGPGKIVTHGDIRLRGCIHLENITLITGSTLYLEDSISSENLTAYAARNIYIRDKSHIHGDLVARMSIILSQSAQTSLGTVLASSGMGKSGEGRQTGTGEPNGSPSTPTAQKPSSELSPNSASGSSAGEKSLADANALAAGAQIGKNTYGILATDFCKIRGLLISGSESGLVKIGKRSEVFGWILTKNAAEIEGQVKGLVWAGKLNCNDNPQTHCLKGKITRALLPPGFFLPQSMARNIKEVRLITTQWKNLQGNDTLLGENFKAYKP